MSGLKKTFFGFWEAACPKINPHFLVGRIHHHDAGVQPLGSGSISSFVTALSCKSSARRAPPHASGAGPGLRGTKQHLPHVIPQQLDDWDL